MWCQRIHLDLFSHRCVKLWPICQSACIGPLRGDWTFSLHGMPRTLGILVRKNSSIELWKISPFILTEKDCRQFVYIFESNNFSLRFDRKNDKIIPLWFHEYFLHFSATLVMILLSMTRLMENWTVLGPIWLNYGIMPRAVVTKLVAVGPWDRDDKNAEDPSRWIVWMVGWKIDRLIRNLEKVHLLWEWLKIHQITEKAREERWKIWWGYGI